MHMIVTLPDNRRVQLQVKKCFGAVPGDICILEVKPVDNTNWEEFGGFPLLRMAPPNLHEAVFAVGFPSSGALIQEDDIVNLYLSPRIATGFVEEIHDSQRDSVLMNYPCYRISALLLGGMSGGPVIDFGGRICGVVSRSFTFEPGEQAIGYASTLWPAARTQLGDGISKNNRGKRLYHLVKNGLIKTIDANRVECGLNQDGSSAVRLLPKSDA